MLPYAVHCRHLSIHVLLFPVMSFRHFTSPHPNSMADLVVDDRDCDWTSTILSGRRGAIWFVGRGDRIFLG